MRILTDIDKKNPSFIISLIIEPNGLATAKHNSKYYLIDTHKYTDNPRIQITNSLEELLNLFIRNESFQTSLHYCDYYSKNCNSSLLIFIPSSSSSSGSNSSLSSSSGSSLINKLKKDREDKLLSLNDLEEFVRKFNEQLSSYEEQLRKVTNEKEYEKIQMDMFELHHQLSQFMNDIEILKVQVMQIEQEIEKQTKNKYLKYKNKYLSLKKRLN
jgi:hypothetical protein